VGCRRASRAGRIVRSAEFQSRSIRSFFMRS
jgi:hypothetical protein